MPAMAGAGTRKQMIRAINTVRGANVRFSPRLSERATAWARHLMRAETLAHSSSASGEIIEWHTGTAPAIRSTVTEWLNSPGHRAVMLNNRFRRAGAGRATGYMNGRRSTIWVVRFAR